MRNAVTTVAPKHRVIQINSRIQNRQNLFEIIECVETTWFIIDHTPTYQNLSFLFIGTSKPVFVISSLIWKFGVWTLGASMPGARFNEDKHVPSKMILKINQGSVHIPSKASSHQIAYLFNTPGLAVRLSIPSLWLQMGISPEYSTKCNPQKSPVPSWKGHMWL